MAKRGGKEGKGWKFTARERRAVLFLLPLVAVLAWLIWGASRPRFDDSAELLGDALAETGTRNNETPAADRSEAGARDAGQAQLSPAGETAPALFRFDPNTATYEDFRALGIAKNTAAGIVKYRERGKVFQIPEDFATCYGITDSMYAELKPYIRIGEEFRLKAAPNRTTADNTARESATENRPAATTDARAIPGPGTGEASGREAVSGQTALPLVELNTADSAALVAVRGIGARSAAEIIAYRQRLGGFHSHEQLAEIKIVTEQNYERIVEQIWVDSCEIQKIDINFATPNAVAGHPYMGGRVARRVLKNRQMKGGWSTIEEMIEDHTLTSEEAARLAPYLRFTAIKE